MVNLTRVYGRQHEPYSLFYYHRLLGFGSCETENRRANSAREGHGMRLCQATLVACEHGYPPRVDRGRRKIWVPTRHRGFS